MKSILFTVVLAALALPAAAQQSAGMASGVNQKGMQPTIQRISIDRGALLRDPQLGNFRPQTGLSNKGNFHARNESLLRGTERSGWHSNKGDLRFAKGLAFTFRQQYRTRGGAYGSLLSNRSSFFGGNGRKSQFTGVVTSHVPGVDSFVREELTYHFAWLGGSVGLQVKDPVAKDSWSLRMACRPKVKKESDNRYTAQVACYGRLGWSQQQLPVIVQFTLLGSDKKWKVHGQPTIVQANRITRPGQNVMANVWAEELPAQAVETTTTEAGQ